ncbi:uncharacterized protein K02A2.6-like [Cydia pomonella]|uniref:uncharacterized protein K02A2.6-like n=1 Tax=Cydia pomonella TaxID=82600 RepID=UPI002ADE12E6|nr:uncharacterized protein K02A2.6-like [Cydia pomonella]
MGLEQFSCNKIDSKLELTMDSLISRYKDIFADGLGRYTGGTVALRVRSGAAPVYLRARPLAYALRAPVERALDQLQRDGIITPVETSDWATPIVPVVKRDGDASSSGVGAVISHQMRDGTERPVAYASRVLNAAESGWPAKCDDPELQPYWVRRHELYSEAGCIMWGYRMVIPTALRNDVLRELHIGHFGVVKMKSLARSYVWWPGIDAEIEKTCRECTTCALEAPAPAKAAPQAWPYLEEVWSRLHMDFLGPLHGMTYLVVVDSSSKWIEVKQMTRTTADDVIRVLREIFARFGLPKMMVSDNGPPFTSGELTQFMQFNGIKQTYSPVYHPSSNGAAEGAVKLVKKTILKALRDKQDVDAALQSYLLAYRNSIHSSTGESPARLLQRRGLRTRLDLLRADAGATAHECARAAQLRQRENAGGVSRSCSVGDNI